MMNTSLRLSAIFFAHLPVRLAEPEDANAFEELLRNAWKTGHDQWPQIALLDEDFMRHLARNVPSEFTGHPPMNALEGLVFADVYLACACVCSVLGAIEILESEYLSKLPGSNKLRNVRPQVIDEVCQTVRINLLVGAVEGRPDLAGFRGRSTLMTWIGVIAVRMAQKWGALVPAVPVDVGLLDALPAGDDPEIEFIKSYYRPQIEQAIREAFARLSRKERGLIRLHHIERVPTTEIAPLYGKNQSTISRWIKDAREKVYAETKRLLQERLRLASQEFESLVRVLRSTFDLSLSRILEESSSEDEGSHGEE